MPKKNKKSKKHIPWKTIFGVLVLATVAVAIWAQISFNRHMEQQVEQLSIFNMRSLLVDAVESLTELKNTPDNDQRIPEVRLQLPKPSESLGKVLYSYEDTERGNSKILHVTTKEITEMGISQMNGTNMHELFERVPEAQACSRGFRIHFWSGRGQPNPVALTRKLADGRTMMIYREEPCGDHSQPNTDKAMRAEAMDELEKYLLQAQSY